jgi:hypothetical protein
LATKLGGLSSPPSFLFFLKAWILIIWFSFFRCDFYLNLWKLVPTIILGRRIMISLIGWWKEGE